MIDELTNVLDAAWALRWWLVAAAFLILGAAYAETLVENRRLRRGVAVLEEKVRKRDRTIGILRNLLRTNRQRGQLIVGRVRSS